MQMVQWFILSFRRALERPKNRISVEKGLDIPTNSIAILGICYHMFALVLLRKASIWLDVPRYGLDVTSQPRLVHGSTDVLSEMFTGS